MPLKIKKIILVLVGLMTISCSWAQDVPLSQYYHNLFFINPAYAGAIEGSRLSSFYRNQWPLSESNFKTYGIAYDQILDKYNSGPGVLVSSDNSGVFTSVAIDVAYSYRIKLPIGVELNMGLQGGLVQKYRNVNELIFEEQEPVAGGLNKIYPDFAIGGVMFYNKLYAGLSIHHLNRPKTAADGDVSSKISMKFTGQLGYVIEFNTSLVKQERVLMPNILIQQQGFQQNITWGAVFQYDYILGGLMVRHNILSNFDVLIFSAGFKTSMIRIAYSYDMNIGKKTFVPLGAHEISLSLLYNKEKKKKYKAIGCPSFLK